MKLFLLLSRFPYPLEKGDKLRAYHHIKELSKYNEIHLCALSNFKIPEENIQQLSPFCKTIEVIRYTKWSLFINLVLAFFNGNPFQVGLFYSKKAQRKIDEIILSVKPDHIYCQLIRVTEFVKNRNIPKTLDYQDILSKNVWRRIGISSFYMKPVLKSEYKRLLKYEEEIFHFFNNKIIISYPDRDLIPHPEKEKIHVVPNGVNTEYYLPIESEKEFDLVFTGNMSYSPNVNSVEFLVKQILPIVWKTNPNIKLLISGANPAQKVLALQSEKVIVSGWVDDMRTSYAKSKIFIAPMQIGTGLQNKLLEAMAMRMPCISSRLANSALGAKDKEEILIGENESDYANHILFLLNNPIEAKKIAENAQRFVKDNFNWEALTDKINILIQES
ncbi:MAG: glycosyltransferase [Bacteroidetes bacterium]|nr:glycosyltransferase [Bacteroidota bacterium]